MELTSPAFKNDESIPAKYGCDGENTNPPLAISQVPEKTASLALIVDDPDAPAGSWLHWTVWNIDPQTTAIAENSVPAGAIEGMTDFDKTGYGGPCPPVGTHRYFFRIYALDAKLDLAPEADKTQLEQVMRNHVLEQAELIGLYYR